MTKQATIATMPIDVSGGSWIKRHPVVTMVALMYVLAWPALFAAAADSYGLTHFNVPEWLGFLTGWAPGIAAIVVTAIVGGRQGVRELLRKIVRWRVGVAWYGVALFGIAVAMLMAVGLYGLFTGQWLALPIAHTSPANVALTFAAMLGLGAVINTEEMAWRGFALPRLQSRFGALAACVLIAIPEALLHLPYFFVKGSFFQQQGPLAFALFTLALAIIYAWVFNNARGSVLVCTLMHAAQNAWSNLVAPDNAMIVFYVLIGLLCLAALVIVVVNGPVRLSRRPNDEVWTY